MIISFTPGKYFTCLIKFHRLKAKIAVLFYALLFSLTISNLTAQPTKQWDNTLGGDGNDNLYSGQQTKDGGYILGGRSESTFASGDKTQNGYSLNGADFWLIKLDASGNKVWDKIIGGNSSESLHSLQQTADGGFILGGESSSNISGDKSENSIGGGDYWVVKLNAAGIKEWDKTFGGTGWDQLTSIQQTRDGGYILGGSSTSNAHQIGGKSEDARSYNYEDYWIIKLNAAGAKEWDKTIGGLEVDVLKTVRQTVDGGFIVGGNSSSNASGDKSEGRYGSEDYWVVKLDASGKIEWENTIGGSDYEVFGALQATPDGGCILGGWSNSPISGDKSVANKGVADFWLVKLNAAGNKEWDNTYGGAGSQDVTSIQLTKEGGYILGGKSYAQAFADKSENSRGVTDFWVVKITASGKREWDKTLGGDLADELTFVQQTTDGGYFMGGSSHSNLSGDKSEGRIGTGYSYLNDYWVVKLSPAGDYSTGERTIKTLSLNKTGYCAGSGEKIPVAFTTTGTYSAGEIFYAQLSDAWGSFAAPVTIGTGTISPIQATLPNNTSAGTRYRIRVVSSLEPVVIGENNGTNVTIANATSWEPIFINGPREPCKGSTEFYFMYTATDYTQIAWTVPTDWIILQGQGTQGIMVAVGESEGIVSFAGKNLCGTVMSINHPVKPSSLPVMPDLITASAQMVCAGDIVVYSTSNTKYRTGDRFNWSVPYDWTIVSGNGTNSISVQVGSEPGSVEVAVSNLCGMGSKQTFAVTFSHPTSPIVKGSTGCGSYSLLELTASGAPSGGYYKWYASSTGYHSYLYQTSATLRVTPYETTTYYVSIVDGRCESLRVPVTATIIPKPNFVVTANVYRIPTGGSTTLKANNISDFPENTYVWSPATSLSSTTGVTVTANPTENTTYTVTATNSQGCTSVATVTITVIPPQIITFPPIPNKIYGEPPFALNATSSSGLQVIYQILSGPATVLGNMVTLTGTGTVVVRAYHPGNENYMAATPVDQSFTVNQASACKTTGTILRELWSNISGTSISTIPLNTIPSATSALTSFEAPSNIADNYGQRIRGNLCVPATGDYTFYIAGDDETELWLSTGDNPAAKQKIAYSTGTTNPREWSKYASQKSAVITLQANTRYYIEALHKEGLGGDHLAVGWITPGTSAINVIPGSVLTSIYQPPTVSISSPTNNSSFMVPANVTIDVTATNADGSISKVEFFNGAFKLEEDVTAPYSYTWINVTPGNYTLTARATDYTGGTANSAPVQVTVNSSTATCTASGTVLREFYNNIPGTSVAAIPINTEPYYSDQLTSLETLYGISENSGQRLRGYICAPASGNYTFFIASDDESELWLSASDNPASKQKIAFVTGFTGAREWNKFTSQKSAVITLQANTRYYVEVLHKQGLGYSNMAVGWLTPGASAITVIQGTVLSPFIANPPPTVSITSPVAGAVYSQPAAITITADAADSDGNITKVEFYAGGTKVGEDLTAPYGITWSYAAAANYNITAIATDNRRASTTSAPVAITVIPAQLNGTVLVAKNASWKYHDKGLDLGTAWTAPGYDDGSWLSGKGVLGYGDPVTTSISYGASSTNKHPTSYFRHSFEVADARTYSDLLFNIRRDDGAVVFLNGVEQFRTNMPGGLITYNTNALVALSGADETTYYTFKIPASQLLNGRNVIAVSVHQDNGGSSDLSFDLEVKGEASTNQTPVVSISTPVSGSTFTAPATVTIMASAIDADGSITKVEFYQGEIKLGEDLTAPYSFNWTIVAAGNYTLTAKATDNLGALTSSAPVSITVNAAPVVGDLSIPKHSVWKYHDKGFDPGTGWTALTYNDAAWSVGWGVLGYGDPVNVGLQYGYNETDKYPSYYFRRSFEVTDASAYGTILFNIRRDDGAVVYLNGVEQFRTNMPSGTISNNTYAAATVAGSDETTYYTFRVPATNLLNGRNVIAVSVHQDKGNSSDMTFNMEVKGELLTNRLPTISLTSPANNSTYTAPASISLTAAASDLDGTVTRVEFFQGGNKLGEDTTAPFSFAWSNVAAGTYSLTAKATDNLGATTISAAVSVTVNAASPTSSSFPIAKNSVWKYHDKGVDLGTSWTSPTYDDASWASGAGVLGYGDPVNTALSFGPSSTSKYPTYYFRKSFDVADASSYSSLVFNLRRDDGAVVYLNGVELFRTNMPTGPVAYNTFALVALSGTDETNYFTFRVPATQLKNGKNVIAVSIHQDNGGSSDMTFDLEVKGETALTQSLTTAKSLSANTENFVDQNILLQANPNPYTNNTTISFSLDQEQEYSLMVYDGKGALIKVLQAGKAEANTLVKVEWTDAKIPAGVYLVRLVTKKGAQTLRVVRE